MPRNGSGVYDLPAGTSDFTPNTVIESSKIDALTADIKQTFNTAQPMTLGGTGGTSQITSFDALSAQGTDVASASTTNLTTATGPVVDITGTTTINTVTLAAGTTRMARAAAAFQLTASANLIVNASTSVNYTTTAGDVLLFRGYPSSVVRVDVISGLSRGGGTLTGDLTVSKASALVILNKPASGTATAIEGRSNNLKRWRLVLGESDTESGGNAGSTFYLYAYDDTGATPTAMLTIARNADAVNLPKGQLSFPATANPSSDPNTMDDYEEGTFTPAFSATGSTFNYATQSGFYTKIGRVVNFWIDITLAGSGNTLAANPLSITGLPFTPAANPGTLVFHTGFANFTGTYIQVNARLTGGSTTMAVVAMTAAASNNVAAQNATALNATGGSWMRFYGSYFV